MHCKTYCEFVIGWKVERLTALVIVSVSSVNGNVEIFCCQIQKKGTKLDLSASKGVICLNK